MKSIRKWFCKPKRSDRQLLAQFYFANEELNEVSQELDSFDGRQDPERCTALVNHLRRCQDKVLSIVEQIMFEAIPDGRANRDYRAKFPEDVLLDSLPGQLWFGAECLGAGSTIMNREIESAALRPLARGLTKTLDTMRMILKEQCYDNLNEYSDKVKDILKRFDETFAEFELSYVSTMVPVKSSRDYDTQQDVIVLFCETLNRALTDKLLTQDQVDDYDPGLMFTIPRLAIVCGLVVFPEGPLNMVRETTDISEMFRPFQALLVKIKELLQTLSEEELHLLEKALCNSTGSWEDIEEQLKLMGRGSKVRCNAAVQTDPTEDIPSMVPEAEGGGATSGELMFGMSPIEEEVQQKLEREVSILGSSPNQAIIPIDAELDLPLADATEETVDDGIESVSSGIVDDNDIRSPSEVQTPDHTRTPSSIQSPGYLSNGDIFDDVDSHTLGMSPVEQKVEYRISPKHRPLMLRRPLFDRVAGHDGMSHVYGMSPMDACDKVFATDSPFHSSSPLDSPIADFETSHASSDVLGMSPVDSVPTIACKVMSDIVKEEGAHFRSDPNCDSLDRKAVDETDNNVTSVNRDEKSATCTSFPKQDESSRTVADADYVQTIVEEIQSAENHHQVCGDQGVDSVQCKEEGATVTTMCEQLVDNIVQYAVQCSAFKSRHHGGRCIMTLKLSQHHVTPTCSSCGKVLYDAKDQQDKLYCEQCKQIKTDGSPSCEKDTTESMGVSFEKCKVKEQKGPKESNSEYSSSVTVPLSECAKVIEENRVRNENNDAKQQPQSRCTCGRMTPGKATDGNAIKSPAKSPSKAVDDATKANNGDSATKAPKSVSPQWDDAQQNPEIVYSTGAIQKSGGVMTESANGTQWSCNGSSWESPVFGKGKPSTELSSVEPCGERIATHEDGSGTSTPLDDSILANSDSYNSRPPPGYQVQSPSSGRVYPASAINRVTGSRGLRPEAALGEDQGAGGDSRRESNVSIAVCSSCGDELVDDDEMYQWESDDSDSDSTSSVSDNDEHEIAIAIQAAELSARQEVRSHFTSSWDLVHRLFVCIAGVADQLQTNYASDLRNILKVVFEITANPHKLFDESELNPDQIGAIATPNVQSPSTEGQSEISSPDQIPGFDNEITVVMDSMPDDSDQVKTELPSAAGAQPLNGTKLLKLAPLEKGESLEMEATLSDEEWQAQQRKLDDSRDTDDEVFTLNLEDESSNQNTNQSLLDDNNKVENQRTNDADDDDVNVSNQQQQDVTAAVVQEFVKKDDTLRSSDDQKIAQDETVIETGKFSPTDRQSTEQLRADASDDDVKQQHSGEFRHQESTKESEPEQKEEKVGDMKDDSKAATTVEGVDSAVTVSDDQDADSSSVELHDQKICEGGDATTTTNTDQESPVVEDAVDQKGASEDTKAPTEEVLAGHKYPTIGEKTAQNVAATEEVGNQKASAQNNAGEKSLSFEEAVEQKPLATEEIADQKYPEIGDSAISAGADETVAEGGDFEATSDRDQRTLGGDNFIAGACGGSSRSLTSLVFVTDQSAAEGGEVLPAVKPKKKRHKSGDLGRRAGQFEEPPLWVPDEDCSQCTACQAIFTMIRRKHHCRNCGKIFCSRCSANCVPLPKFGQEKPVRVCNRCYMFQVTPFQH